MSIAIAYARIILPPSLAVDGFETVLQQAVYDTLTAASLSAPIYDDVPQGAAFPYVTIGEDTLADWSTDDNEGVRAAVTVHVWDRERGRKSVKALQNEVQRALSRATMSAAGYNFVTTDLADSESFLDADGKTRHGVQTFNVLIERL